MDEKVEQQTTTLGKEPIARELTEEERRKALRKLGKYAVYAAPALLAMTSGAKAQVFSGPAG